MSKVENEANDAKRLALKVKTLEMALRQSVPKKEHHDVVSGLEKKIDSLEGDLDRAREENQKTIAINKQIAGVEALIASLTKIANSQGKQLDSIDEAASARGKALVAQGRLIDKLAQGTVPAQVHLQALSKIRDLEEDKRGMVRRFDYNSVEARCEELSRQLAATVPAADYAALKERFDEATRQIAGMVPESDYTTMRQKVEELEGAMYTMVPREKLVSSQERVKELEARLAEHVPQSVYDELVSRVVSLAEAVTGGEVLPEAKSEPEADSAAQPASGESIPEPQGEAPAPAEPAAAVTTAPEGPEVREISSQLVEISTKSQEAPGEAATEPTPQQAAPEVVVTVSQGTETSA